jgi:nitroreductase
VLHDTTITKDPGCDHGIAAQSIMLGARQRGLAGCMIGTIDRDKLYKIIDLPDHYNILLVLAIGTPKETVVIERLGPDGNICYWRDENGTHHVPKRSLDNIVVKSYH